MGKIDRGNSSQVSVIVSYQQENVMCNSTCESFVSFPVRTTVQQSFLVLIYAQFQHMVAAQQTCIIHSTKIIYPCTKTKVAAPFKISIEWLLLYHPKHKQAREHAGPVSPFLLALLGSVH